MTANRTLATNGNYQLTERAGQYYLYVFKRKKIFEVDELIAEVAELNGKLSPAHIESLLKTKWPPEKLQPAIKSLQQSIPEVFG